MWLVMPAGRSRRRPGRRAGWCEARKSAKELLPGAKNARGRDPPSEGSSMRSPCHEPGLIGGRGSLPASRGVEAPEVDFDDAVGVLDLGDRQAEGRDAVAMEVVDESAESWNLVADVAECLVAEEAQDASHAPRSVVMVNMLRRIRLTSGTNIALSLDHRVYIRRSDAVSAAQVIVPAAAASTRHIGL